MHSQVRAAIVLFLMLTLITGVAYPLAITGIAQAVFADKANGSIIFDQSGRPIGSALVGQEFGTSDPAAAPGLAKWLWGRPSATAPVPYTSLNFEKSTGSGGSNLAPTNPALIDNVNARIAALRAADAAVGLTRPDAHAPIDLVTASGSGLDPHISPAAAAYQVPRIARARGLSEESVRLVVEHHTQGRALSILGEPVVNVLEVNRELEAPRAIAPR